MQMTTLNREENHMTRSLAFILATTVACCAVPQIAHAGGFGAVAVGADPGGSAVTTIVNNKASEDEARLDALRGCVNSNGSVAARSRCAIVSSFQNQCVASAGRAWAVAATEQDVREEVVAKCRAVGPNPSVCVTVSVSCVTNP
jgi:hypothetical protein